MGPFGRWEREERRERKPWLVCKQKNLLKKNLKKKKKEERNPWYLEPDRGQQDGWAGESMKKHTINVGKKRNDVMGQEGGTVIPCWNTDRRPGAGESRDREWMVLMACQPASLPAWEGSSSSEWLSKADGKWRRHLMLATKKWSGVGVGVLSSS